MEDREDGYNARVEEFRDEEYPMLKGSQSHLIPQAHPP